MADYPERPSLGRQILTLVAVSVITDLAGRAAKYAADCIADKARLGYQKYWRGFGGKDPAELMILDASHSMMQGVAPLPKWTEVYNQLGLVMPSMADYYLASKCCSPNTILQIREDMETQLLHTSTMHEYSTDTLETKIFDHYGMATQKALPEPVKVPFYFGKSLTEALAQEDGLRYIQAICGTADASDKIAANLSNLSGVPAENISLCTPPFDELGVSAPRRHAPHRSIAMTYTRSGPHKFLCILTDISKEPGVAHIMTVRR